MGAKWRLDRVGFREHVLNAPWMVAEMDRRAQAMYEFARSIAPVDTGEYVDSFFIESGRDGPPGSSEQDRAYAELSNIAPDAVFVEWGNGHDNGSHVLTKTLDAGR